MNKKQRIVIIIAAIALILTIFGITYAYFTANIIGSESTSTISVKGAKLQINYQDNSGNITLNNIYPRQEAWVTKSFTIIGTSTIDITMNYKIGLEMITSDFASGDLTYSLENTNADSGTPVSDKNNEPLNGTGTTWFGYGQFITGDDQEHSYTLKIFFPDTGEDQNDLQEAQFAAKVVIEEAGTGNLLKNKILADNPIRTPLTTPGQENSSSEEKVLASTLDDYGTSYYFRGAIENNYVVFAGMCWRIVRIDGLGNIKLVLSNYNSDKTNITNPCATTYDATNAAYARYDGETYTSSFRIDWDEDPYMYNAYVGFMYGTPGTTKTGSMTDEDAYLAEHTVIDLTHKSKILTNLETWYTNNLANYEKELADVIWCNDQSLSTQGYREATDLGYYTESTYYGAFDRRYPTAEAHPSLVCPDAGTDGKLSKFTVSDETKGNGLLTYKIGLLTVDEAFLAGLYAGDNSSYLIKNTGSSWWTLSPVNYGGAYVVTSGGYISPNGQYSYNKLDTTTNAIRPAVSLKSTIEIDTTKNSDGTSEKPYYIVTS